MKVSQMQMESEGKKRKMEERRGRDGLSRDRLVEVMRSEDERGERDSRIQIRSRLTLLECVSLSKCPYSIFTEHTHTHIFTQNPPFLFNCSLPSSLLSPSEPNIPVHHHIEEDTLLL